MTWRQIQEALKNYGFSPGPIDGIVGRRTTAAVKAFQRSRSLTVDGVVGPRTLAALWNSGPVDARVEVDQLLPPWYSIAESLLGTREIRGARHNQVIMSWAEKLGLWYPDDETPWCGLFVANCLATALSDEPNPGNPLGARNWQKFGREIETPTLGAVVVFWRGSRNGWKGHVGFYDGEDATHIHCLGGNQSNKVSIARISKSRLLGYYWAETVALPNTGRVHRSATGEVTHNEA